MLDRIIQRVIRIVKLDASVFKEIEHDETANQEAAIVVVVAALLAAIGAGAAAAGAGGFFGTFFLTLIGNVLVGWLLWSYLTMLIGTRLFSGEATFWEMARVLGYANAPVALGVLGIFGCLGALASLVGWILSLIAGFLAVREALDLPTDKAILTVVIGWVVVILVNILLAFIL